jgi:putative DNA primase/helicase
MKSALEDVNGYYETLSAKSVGVPMKELVQQKQIDTNYKLQSDIIRLAYQGEQGLAELLAMLFKGKFLYNHTKRLFVYYALGCWLVDQTKWTRLQAINTLKAHLKMTSDQVDDEVSTFAVRNDSLDEEERKKIKQLEKSRDALRALALKLNKKALIENVLELSSSLLPAVSNDFDKDPYLFNLANGTMDFRTGKFREHKPDDLLSKQSLIEYEPKADCPKWKTFLEQIFAQDKELIGFIQQCIGYSLTGLTDLQSLLFCFGPGGNGKSNFFSVIKMLLGDYYVNIPIDVLLMKQRDNNSDYQLAKLKGARVVVASEITQGKSLHESLVKDLTGGDPINARKIFESPYTFEPTHKLWLYGNHKPVIKGTDNGIWRRILLIPFLVTIEKTKQREKSEMLSEFTAELPGILNWAIDGYRRYSLTKKLVVPECVLRATQAYREESDSLAAFIEERCTINKAFVCLCTDFLAEYKKWCESENEELTFKNSRQLNENMRERGFTTSSGGKNRTVLNGISIKQAEDSEPQVK